MTVTRLLNVLSTLSTAFSANRGRRRKSSLVTDAAEMLEVRVVPAAVQVVPVATNVTTESGGTAQFTVVLESQPKGKITVPIKSSNTSEGTVSVKKLVFTNTNWATAQTFTVRGIDDTLVDGDKPYQVVLGKFKGSDKGYKALAPVTLNLTNTDNDVPGIKVTVGNNLQTTEGGGKSTFTVKLATKPTANVTIPLHSTDTTEGTVTGSLVFTPNNWNQSQTVTITGVNDFLIDGNQAYQVIFDAAQSAHAAYAGMTSAAISVTNVDNDSAGLTVTPKTGIVNEGAVKNISFKLNAQPTADVTVTLTTTAGADQALLSAETLTFTPANWNATQVITITGVSLDGIDGDIPFSFDVQTTSDDPLFNSLPTQSVTVTIHDTEAPAPNYDGSYTGSYSGSVTTFGISSPVNGTIAATVSGTTFHMTQPTDLTGTLPESGDLDISIPVSAAPFSGVRFIGETVENPDGSVTVSGTWSITKLGIHGTGTWSITRPPLV